MPCVNTLYLYHSVRCNIGIIEACNKHASKASLVLSSLRQVTLHLCFYCSVFKTCLIMVWLLLRCRCRKVMLSCLWHPLYDFQEAHCKCHSLCNNQCICISECVVIYGKFMCALYMQGVCPAAFVYKDSCSSVFHPCGGPQVKLVHYASAWELKIFEWLGHSLGKDKASWCSLLLQDKYCITICQGLFLLVDLAWIDLVCCW